MKITGFENEDTKYTNIQGKHAVQLSTWMMEIRDKVRPTPGCLTLCDRLTMMKLFGKRNKIKHLKFNFLKMYLHFVLKSRDQAPVALFFDRDMPKGSNCIRTYAPIEYSKTCVGGERKWDIYRNMKGSLITMA